MLKIDLSTDKKTMVLSVDKIFSNRTSKNINNYIVPILLSNNIENIIINFEGVKKIDLTGYNSLLKLKWTVKIKKINMYLDNIPYHLISEINSLKLKNLSNKKRMELINL